MSDIYIPIDYSDVKDLIPTGEDIVYSTLCQVSAGSAAYMSKWISHVLMTTKGIVYTKPIGRKKPPLLIYEPWNKIYGISKGHFQKGPVHFKFVLDKNYETKEGFKQRKNEFKSRIKPIRDAGKEYWETNFPSKKERKAEIQKIYTLYNEKKQNQ